MPLELKIVSEHADLVGDDAVREYHEGGGTIGRSLQNDWILPDPDRFISGRHAVIDFKGGIYYLADTSSNGVYVNNEMEPIGKGNPRRLFDGDRLRLGDFEIQVAIEQAVGQSYVGSVDQSFVQRFLAPGQGPGQVAPRLELRTTPVHALGHAECQSIGLRIGPRTADSVGAVARFAVVLHRREGQHHPDRGQLAPDAVPEA